MAVDRVLAAANGAEALLKTQEKPERINLLLTDVIMPGMNGRELAQRMAEIRPNTKVLYMSGYAWPFHASQGRLDPDVALVEKPFSDAELLAAAGQALSGHNQRLRISQGTSTN